MSGTPRTDTVLASYFNPGPSRLCDLARELERELNSANHTIRQQELLIEENLRLKERIQRLEEVAAKLANCAFLGTWSQRMKDKAMDELQKLEETKP